MKEKIQKKVNKNQSGERLDVFVLNLLIEKKAYDNNLLSRSVISGYIPFGVCVNDEQKKPGYRLREGDLVEIDEEKLKEILKQKAEDKSRLDYVFPQKGEIKIVFECKDYIVLNKPAGLVVHPGVNNTEDTLANFVRGYLEAKGEFDENTKRGGIVHRLDKGVSGLMVVAKNIKMQKYLSIQFENHKVRKIYVARVCKLGNSSEQDSSNVFIDKNIKKLIKTELRDKALKAGENRGWKKVEGGIRRDPVNRKRMKFESEISKSGKKAVSYVKFLNDEVVLVRIVTGRMHQIRATLRFLGYTIIGDDLYGYRGKDFGNEIYLRSMYLEFIDLYGDRKSYKLV